MIKAINNPESYNTKVSCKSRIVDPLFRDGNILRRLSDKYLEWKEVVKEELKPKQYFLKFAL